MSGRRRSVTGRASDERLLKFMQLRAAGVSQADIGLRFGVHAGQVARDISHVIAADLAESGEPAAVVRAGYPWRNFPEAAQ